MLKLVDTSQKSIILGLFILDKVACLRALPDPPPPQDGVSEFTGQYPLFCTFVYISMSSLTCLLCDLLPTMMWLAPGYRPAEHGPHSLAVVELPFMNNM